jgi:hypothetical protein
MLFIDHSTLTKRVVNGVLNGRNFVFLFGSGTSRAQNADGLGVPMASEILQSIRDRLGDSNIQTYQEGFERLDAEFDPDEPNRIIRHAVLKAYSGAAEIDSNSPSEFLEHLEENVANWYRPAVLRALTILVYMHPKCFGRTILTTNFDPLIQISLSAGRRCWHALYLHSDGSLNRTRGNGASVVHLHGHWIGSDTLHTRSSFLTRDLNYPRPSESCLAAKRPL